MPAAAACAKPFRVRHYILCVLSVTKPKTLVGAKAFPSNSDLQDRCCYEDSATREPVCQCKAAAHPRTVLPREGADLPGRLALDTIGCVQIPWPAQSVGNQPCACLCALTYCWPCRELVHLHTAGLQGPWVLYTACRKFVSSHPAGMEIMHLCTAGLQGSCLGGSGGG